MKPIAFGQRKCKNSAKLKVSDGENGQDAKTFEHSMIYTIQ